MKKPSRCSSTVARIAYLLLAAATAVSAAPGLDVEALRRGYLLEMQRGASQEPGGPPQWISPVDRARMGVTEEGRKLPQGQYVEQFVQPTQIERDFGKRAEEPLRQFGYDLFAGKETTVVTPYSGRLGDDYELGIGDEIVVTFHGQVAKTMTSKVDREGRLVLPDLTPIPAAGRRFGDFQKELESRVHASMIGTDVFVSLGSVKRISVLVVGEVGQPGVQQLTGMSTLVDALLAAGGVKKTGSLRNIQLVRGSDKQVVDLYGLLVDGSSGEDVKLSEGDRLVVPTIGDTVAIGGAVKRPGIYELKRGKGADSALSNVVYWAGGPVRAKGNRYLRLRLTDAGQEQVSEQRDLKGSRAEGGDLIKVVSGDGAQLGSVQLEGHVRTPGMRSLAVAPTVGKLVGSVNALGDDPYLLFAVLYTKDDRTKARGFVPLNLGRILRGEEDRPLRSDDVLIVLGDDEVRYLMSQDVQNVLARKEAISQSLQASAGLDRDKKGEAAAGESLSWAGRGQGGASSAAGDGGQPPFDAPYGNGPAGGYGEAGRRDGSADPYAQGAAAAQRRGERRGEPYCRGLSDLSMILASERAGRFINAIRSVSENQSGAVQERIPCPAVYDQYPGLLPFVLEHVAALNGEVRRPGAYPIAKDTALTSLMVFAGGETREFDSTNVEVSRNVIDALKGSSTVVRERVNLRNKASGEVVVNPGDVIRFNPVVSDRDNGSVLLVGEFKHPGFYDLTRGETLLEVIKRAGGLTEQAYPYGSVLSRERTKKEEKRLYERSAQELQDAMVVALGKGGSDAGRAAGASGAVGELVKRLRETEPVGRIVMEADPTVLEVRPELDTILEPEDRLYMPKRSNTVTVSGEVLNPGTMAFQPGLSVDSYLKMAGGIRQGADEERTFVVFPDGKAQPLKVSFWNYQSQQIPPGSTIIVPRDPAPFEVMTFSRDIAGLLSSLAITAASIATINR